MKCPCCGNEMQSGFVRAMGRGGVCWVTENRPMGAAVGCPGFLLLGKAPHSETDHVPAQRCAACRMVTNNRLAARIAARLTPCRFSANLCKFNEGSCIFRENSVD